MATIQGIYIALFGRPADPAGLAYWEAETKGGTDLSGLIGRLTQSDEYLDRFEGQSQEQIVSTIYQALFGREPDAAGLAFFVDALASGSQTIETIAINILDGARNTDATIIENKEAAADLFTASLDTPQEIAAYTGDDAADAGRAFISHVTADPASVPTQAEVDQAIDQGVVNPPQEPTQPEPGTGGGGGGGGGGGEQPPTYHLTQGTEGVDILEGTAARDEIHGLGGNDTLAGGRGSDIVFGDAGNDSITASDLTIGADFVSGKGDTDILVGGAGRDTLAGNWGSQNTTTIMFGGDQSTLVNGIYGVSHESDTISPIPGNSWHPLKGEFANVYQPRDGQNILVMSDAQDSVEFLVSATGATPFDKFSSFNGTYEVHNFNAAVDEIWFARVGGGASNQAQPVVTSGSFALDNGTDNSAGTLTLYLTDGAAESSVSIHLVGLQGYIPSSNAADDYKQFLLGDGSPLA